MHAALDKYILPDIAILSNNRTAHDIAKLPDPCPPADLCIITDQTGGVCLIFFIHSFSVPVSFFKVSSQQCLSLVGGRPKPAGKIHRTALLHREFNRLPGTGCLIDRQHQLKRPASRLGVHIGRPVLFNRPNHIRIQLGMAKSVYIGRILMAFLLDLLRLIQIIRESPLFYD